MKRLRQRGSLIYRLGWRDFGLLVAACRPRQMFALGPFAYGHWMGRAWSGDAYRLWRIRLGRWIGVRFGGPILSIGLGANINGRSMTVYVGLGIALLKIDLGNLSYIPAWRTITWP